MKPIQIWLFRISLLCWFFMPVKVDGQVLNDLKADFSSYNPNQYLEKVFVQTDRTHYITGEILWFKTYCVESISNSLTNLSKVVYIELLNNNHVAVIQTKVELKDGQGNGSIYLPASISTGAYQLRAYTSWMKNFPADYFFEKEIIVINPLKTPAAEVVNNKQIYDIQFFPEGGHLVQGLSSTIGFKITDNLGNGIQGSGVIINQQNDTSVVFSTLKFGIGSFNFNPKPDAIYKAIIIVNNMAITLSLPLIEKSGCVMQTITNETAWHIKIQSSNLTTESKIFVLVHNTQKIEIAKEFYLKDGLIEFDLEKLKLQDGISYVTVFDENRKPVIERVIFKKPSQKLTISAKIVEKNFGKRALVNIPVETINQDKKLINANLSVAVAKNESLYQNNNVHIDGYLGLNAVLRGQIENPDYYLENNDSEANAALNNLLLVQGWSQFNWGGITAKKTPDFKFLPEYSGHIISGDLINNLTNKPAIKINAYLTIPAYHFQFYTSTSDSLGKVYFNTLNNYSQGELIVQTNFQSDSTYRFELNNPYSNQYSPSTLHNIKFKTELENEIANESVNTQVQNIFLNKKLKEFNHSHADSIPFFNALFKTYLLDNYTRFSTMEEVLREYVSSIVITKRQGKFNIKMFDGETPLKTQPLVLLDGVPLFDVDKIFYVDPLKIKKLDVVTKQYLYGSNVYDGILSFSTYNGDLNGFDLDPHALVLDYNALQLERKFYTPVYVTDEQRANRIPDFRNTLYWNPNLTTNIEGKSNIAFYTGDRTGKYTCVIEGITENGELGYLIFDFEVK